MPTLIATGKNAALPAKDGVTCDVGGVDKTISTCRSERAITWKQELKWAVNANDWLKDKEGKRKICHPCCLMGLKLFHN